MVDYDDLPLSHSYSWNWTWRCGLGPKSPDWDDRYANWNSEGCGVLRGVQQDLAAESPLQHRCGHAAFTPAACGTPHMDL